MKTLLAFCLLLTACGRDAVPRTVGPRPPGTQAPEFFKFDLPHFKDVTP